MSSDGSAWPTISPDYLYIFKLGDYQHVLRPGDPKAAENLNLVQQAVGHVDLARNMLTERGPFLLADKQQKMDDLISDTEEAINRVIRLLEPARIEQVSEESVRLNTKNAFILQGDEWKSAATFSRLLTTHNRLKTVLHDLKNIEATAQLDTCEVRANTMTDRSNNEPSSPSDPKSTAQVSMPFQADPSNVIAWKRDRQRSKRTSTLSSNGSSVSGLALEDQFAADPRSGVSSQGNTLMTVSTTSTSPLKDRKSSSSSLTKPVNDHENGSEVSGDRLTVIHELDWTTTVAKGQKDKQTSGVDDNAGSQSREKIDVALAPEGTAQASAALPEETSRVMDEPPALENTAVRPTADSGVSESPDDYLRESFANYRQRNKRERDSRQEHNINNTEQGHYSTPAPANLDLNPPSEPLSASRNGPTSSSQDINVRSSFSLDEQENVKQTAREITAALQQPLQQHTDDAIRNDGKAFEAHVAAVETASRIRHAGIASHAANRHSMYATPMQPVSSMHRLAVSVPSTPLDRRAQKFDTAVDPSHLVSPSRMQMSPQPQTSSSTALSRDERPARPVILPQASKVHEIVSIDPVLTRLPTLLRAGPKTRPQPHDPVADHDRESTETREADLADLAKTQIVVDRPITAPPALHPISRRTHPPISGLQPIDEHLHHRWFSDSMAHQPTDVKPPDVLITRAPTIPRKPLPYRNSISVPNRGPSSETQSREAIAKDRLASPESRSPRALEPSKPVLSSPPSPFEPGSVGNPDLPTRSDSSAQSLAVQVSSSPESSRRSSISALDHPDQSAHPPQLSTAPARSLVNPLSMHPPDRPVAPAQKPTFPESSSSKNLEYRPQSEGLVNSDFQKTAPQVDYRSPAFQQSRHFVDPSHNVHLGPGVAPGDEQSSRFRDADHRRAVPHVPVRTITEPSLSQSGRYLEQVQVTPRRASEQGMPPHHSEQYPAQLKSPASQDQAPSNSSSQFLQPPQQTPQSQQQTQPLSLPNMPREVSLNQNVPTRHTDKDLFGRQVFRHQQEKTSTSSIPSIEQTQLGPYTQQPPYQQVPVTNPRQYQQTVIPQQQNQPPTQRYSFYAATPPTTNSHGQQWGAQPQPHMTAYQAQQMPARQYLAPVQEGQAASHTSNGQKVGNDPNVPAQGSKVKKRSSWLVHQANKLSRDRR